MSWLGLCLLYCGVFKVRALLLHSHEHGVLAQRMFSTFMPHKHDGGDVNVQDA